MAEYGSWAPVGEPGSGEWSNGKFSVTLSGRAFLVYENLDSGEHQWVGARDSLAQAKLLAAWTEGQQRQRAPVRAVLEARYGADLVSEELVTLVRAAKAEEGQA